MAVRVRIAEFGIIQKTLAGATVTFYESDDNGQKTETKATLYQAATGSNARANPQTLNSDGQLSDDCWVESTVMCEISNISVATERSIRKIRQNPIHYALPVTSAGSKGVNLEGPEITGGTIDGAVIGSVTPAAATFTALVCSSFVETSDERLKTNIRSLDEAASKLLSLNPVQYQRKSTKVSPRVEMGFIAQEVQKVLPDIVSEGADGYLSLHYLDLLALLVRGYQDMANHIIELNHRIKALEVE